nr:unnamed protein product [Callosobruchus analis]
MATPCPRLGTRVSTTLKLPTVNESDITRSISKLKSNAAVIFAALFICVKTSSQLFYSAYDCTLSLKNCCSNSVT